HDDEWVTFPGGELEGKRPNALCPACREQLKRAAAGTHAPGPPRPRQQASRTLCFQCYRAALDRDNALKAAGTLDTASDERFQSALPFEPVNRPRLEMLKEILKMDRGGVEPYTHRRRQAQIAARHALQAIAG